MFNKAFLEETGNGILRHEEQLLLAEFKERNIPVTLFTAKRIQRRQLPLGIDTFVAGDMDAMHGAMRQLGIEVPAPNDYPASLEPFLHRSVWRSTLGALEAQVLEGSGNPVFAKPADRRKSFTGRVFASLDDFHEIGHVSRRQEVWCSEVVEWRSEFRVYIIDQDIRSIDAYAGDASVALDMEVVKAAVEAFRGSGLAPSAYALDCGVLDTGQTAVVEVNDGYALGAYQINQREYTDLLVTRWRELLSTIRPSDGCC